MTKGLERKEITRQLYHLIEWWVISMSEEETGTTDLELQRTKLIMEILNICFPEEEKQ